MLRISAGERHLTLHAASDVAIVGRDPSCDIVIVDDQVSRQHLRIFSRDGHWLAQDLNSSNGSFVNGRRFEQVEIARSLDVRLGDQAGPPVQLEVEDPVWHRTIATGPAASALGSLTASHQVQAIDTYIGRDPDCDVVLDDLTVSRRHAVIRRGAAAHQIADLGSTNGTFVNGVQVVTATLQPGDVVAIGAAVFRFQEGKLEQYSEQAGAWLCASDISVRVARPRSLRDRALGVPETTLALLNEIGFAVAPGSLVAIVGPSGAGKTTLLKALTGQQRATHGQVLYGGRDLYSSSDLRHRMGYVPQDDLLHPQLTVREALGFAAELRFASDVNRADREARVDLVMKELGLSERATLSIGRLSGGQRKRTSIAAELLTEPSLLFLDEPTSGLDPGHEENVTQVLRQIATAGRTVVTTTHSLVTLERSDRVLYIARGGFAAFYGPPDEAVRYFRSTSVGDHYPRIFAALEEDGLTFGQRFRRSPQFATYVQEPLSGATLGSSAASSEGSVSRPDTLRQFSVLVRRYLAVLRSDRASTVLLAVQAPFFAALFATLYSNNVMKASTASEATILVWLMVVGATWMGTSNAIREIIKEYPIVRRERGLGLSIFAYVGSKATVLAVITVLQCLVLVEATLLPQHLPPIDNMTDPNSVAAFAGGVYLGSQLNELAFDIVLVGLASMAVGLLLSALVRNPDQAQFALPLVLVAQVVLSAPTLASPSVIFAAVGLPSTAQWGTAVSASTLNLNSIRRPSLDLLEQQRARAEGEPVRPDVAKGRANWAHEPAVWLLDIGALILIGSAATVGTLWLLRRRIDGAA